MHWPTARLGGQDSFLLQTSTVELAVSALGGMLGPVTFFPNETMPIEPYHIAPWAGAESPAGTPPMLTALRGDWFCSAFGENRRAYRGQQLPPHGETANRRWQPTARGETASGVWMRLGVGLPQQRGTCEATTALINGQSVIYQRHDLHGLTAPLSVGHHAVLEFPDLEGSGRLSFSPFIHAQTAPQPIDGPGSQPYSCFQPDTPIQDLRAGPIVGGLTTDLTRYPARRGFDDIAIVCADPSLEFAWVAVTFPDERFVWFALRNPRQLASTLLWCSNGGRSFAPWNGRHVNVMGIEDITGFFHAGIAESCEPNALTARGIATCLEPDAAGRLSIPYIQGVVRIPPGFNQVARIERSGNGHLVLQSDGAWQVKMACHLDFLHSGDLPQLELPACGH